jgi:hypothetical protein
MLTCPRGGKLGVHGQRNGCGRRTQDRCGEINSRRGRKSAEWRGHIKLGWRHRQRDIFRNLYGESRLHGHNQCGHFRIGR